MSSRLFTPSPFVDHFKLTFTYRIMSLRSGGDTVVAIIGLFIGLVVEPLFPFLDVPAAMFNARQCLLQRDNANMVVSEKQMFGQYFSSVFTLTLFRPKYLYAPFTAPSLSASRFL